jgi:hypothetical protein
MPRAGGTTGRLRPTVLAALVAAAALLAACTGDPPPLVVEDGPALNQGSSQFPSSGSTGPRVPVAGLVPSGPISTERDGQVIERRAVATRVEIRHDDVLVRDVLVDFDAPTTGVYALEITEKDDGSCPSNVVLEHVAVVGDTAVLPDNAKAVYGTCPFVLRHSRITDVGTGIRITSGATIEGNYVVASHAVPGSGSHRSGLGLNGGSGNVVTGNTIECAGEGCSGALVMYGDFEQVRDVLVERNLLNTTGSYCAYAGSSESKEFPLSQDVRFIDNSFGRAHHETCGRFGPVAGRHPDSAGFVWEGNVWADTGAELR